VLHPRTGIAQDDLADAIKPVGKVELVQDGFTFTEGPAWEPKSKTLYFSDIPNSTIHRLSTDGSISTFTDQSNHTNGILIPRDGRMLGCQMDGQVVQYDMATAKATILASQFDGERFNAPNDLIVDADGGIYFTDPLFRAPTPLPQRVQAVYYIAADGKVSRVTEGLQAPNGIGLSPDGNRLYVCPSQQAEMLVYEVQGPGKLSDPKTFCSLKQPDGKVRTGADGITLDVQGNVYITTHIGVQVFSPQGKPIGVIAFPQQPANVCFGGEEWKTMYVTARTGLYRVKMPIPGLH
jgi:gluconolactonase